jgi:hypothetical protein
MTQLAYKLDSATRPVSERRQPRIAIELAVWVELGNGAHFEARTVNLGLGGAFIETAPPPSYGEHVWLHLRLNPGDAEVLRLPAIVRWTSEHGFGVQFLELGARATYAIGALVNPR